MKKKRWKIAALGVLMAVFAVYPRAVMAAGEGVESTGSADGNGGEDTGAGASTDVWLDVVKPPTQDRLSISVPMAVGFAVVGSTEPGAQTPISAENGTLLLPNVWIKKVKTEEGEKYVTRYTGSGNLSLKNYSTTVPEGQDESARTGLAVEVGAYIEAEPQTALPPGENANWTMTGEKPGTEESDYKKYRLSIDGHPFSESEDNGEGKAGETKETAGVFWMDGTISLDAPQNVEENGWTSAGTAVEPSEKPIEVGVEVGGVQGNYTNPEASVKVGTIHWTVKAAQ